jgi:Peptidase C39 family.
MKLKHSLKLNMLAQPDDTTCGPTCLQAVFNYYGLNYSLDDVIDSVDVLEDGGTLEVLLGIEALTRGFDATLYSFNLKKFDPSWKGLSAMQLYDKLEQQLQYKQGKKFTVATRAYQRFLKMGGNVQIDTLTPDLLDRYFDQDCPILTGLSATYLYQNKREYTDRQNKSVYDDLKGDPMGHFVVLCGMDNQRVLWPILIRKIQFQNPIIMKWISLGCSMPLCWE